MKRLWLILIVFLIISCEERAPDDVLSEIDYLIFGHYYGKCIGEECIEIFKLTKTKLYEDINDNYPSISPYHGRFQLIENNKFLLVRDLIEYFPEKILSESDSVFGCPDCADQGGLYIEYNINKISRNFKLDRDQNKIPSYLHDFLNLIDEKIKIINDITK